MAIEPDSEIDWAALVFEPAWLQQLDRLALKRFAQQGLAEEASSHVIHRLSEDNWAACQHYGGRAKPNTYLLTLTHNFLEEFSRQRFGRPRPPEWLKREGELWVRIWKMICLERQLVASVIDNLTYNDRRDTGFVQSIIRTIKARLPWCGSSAREIPAECFDCGIDGTEAPDSSHPGISDQSTESRLQQHEWEEALLLLAEHLLSEDSAKQASTDANCPSNSSMNMPSPNQEQLAQLRQQMNLEPQERLLLKMVYQQGLKLNLVAKSLNMPSYQPGRLLKGIHQRIAEALRQANIHFDALAIEELSDHGR
ncbi:MAG: hypothetical protein CL693_16805 [Cellvibrionaceae bacterium]|nr:hypothetical protein [Cellvibrionaceae bacterium]|tara:strand:+ start:7411 stop:8340 length:930 start_codon:yes stop_codon:yes gene_type:complete